MSLGVVTTSCKQKAPEPFFPDKYAVNDRKTADEGGSLSRFSADASRLRREAVYRHTNSSGDRRTEVPLLCFFWRLYSICAVS